ncbi:hypothetical protein C6366_12010 [Desulfonatronum sp. SC1]|nr:hypothetical protein C6366_12010 [Desulfonatronum sp. SC1]
MKGLDRVAVMVYNESPWSTIAQWRSSVELDLFPVGVISFHADVATREVLDAKQVDMPRKKRFD